MIQNLSMMTVGSRTNPRNVVCMKFMLGYGHHPNTMLVYSVKLITVL